MARTSSYLISVAVIIAGSMLVVADDPCFQVRESLHPNVQDCETCVNTNSGLNATSKCIYQLTTGGAQCVNTTVPGDLVGDPVRTVEECIKNVGDNTTTTTPPPTTTTVTPPTTPKTDTTTQSTTSASTTKPTDTTTSAPTTKSTTPGTPPTTPSTPSTPTTPGTGPTSNTTAVPPTTAAPTAAPKSGGGMSIGSFFGGIVFTLCMSGLGYLIFRFYKARMDRNYHTL